jgi:hypothetical protein
MLVDHPGIEPDLPAYKTGVITIDWSNLISYYELFYSIFITHKE